MKKGYHQKLIEKLRKTHFPLREVKNLSQIKSRKALCEQGRITLIPTEEELVDFIYKECRDWD